MAYCIYVVYLHDFVYIILNIYFLKLYGKGYYVIFLWVIVFLAVWHRQEKNSSDGPLLSGKLSPTGKYVSLMVRSQQGKTNTDREDNFFDGLMTARVSVHIPCRFYTTKEIIFPIGCLRFFDGFNWQRKYIFPDDFVIFLSVLHRQAK
jgi:hypothetical protein